MYSYGWHLSTEEGGTERVVDIGSQIVLTLGVSSTVLSTEFLGISVVSTVVSVFAVAIVVLAIDIVDFVCAILFNIANAVFRLCVVDSFELEIFNSRMVVSILVVMVTVVVCGMFLDVVCGMFLDVVCGILLDVVCGILLDVVCGMFLDVVVFSSSCNVDEAVCVEFVRSGRSRVGEGDVVTTKVVTFISSVLIVLWNTVTLVTVPRLLTVTIRPQGPVFGHGENDSMVFLVACAVLADIEVILDLGFDQRPLI